MAHESYAEEFLRLFGDLWYLRGLQIQFNRDQLIPAIIIIPRLHDDPQIIEVNPFNLNSCINNYVLVGDPQPPQWNSQDPEVPSPGGDCGRQQ